jgi:hypothetical protein
MHTRQTLDHQLPQEGGLLLAVELGGGLRHPVFDFVERKVDALDAEVGRVCVHGVEGVGVGGNAGRTSGGWVCAFDAAVAGLADLLVSPVDRSAASQVAKQQDHEPDGEEGVEHGSALRKEVPADLDEREAHQEQDIRAMHSALVRGSASRAKHGHSEVLHRSLLQRQAEQANARQHKAERSNDPLVLHVAENGQNRAEEGYEDGEKAGHSGLGFLLAWLGRNQFGPDAGVGLLAQHLPRQFALRIDLGAARALWIHVSAPGQALIEVLLIDARQSGEALAVVGVQLICHDAHLSESLGVVKLFASGRV